MTDRVFLYSFFIFGWPFWSIVFARSYESTFFVNPSYTQSPGISAAIGSGLRNPARHRGDRLNRDGIGLDRDGADGPKSREGDSQARVDHRRPGARTIMGIDVLAGTTALVGRLHTFINGSCAFAAVEVCYRSNPIPGAHNSDRQPVVLAKPPGRG